MSSDAAEPLTPFDALMRLDDRPGYPMVFYFRLAFAGVVNEPALQEAAARAVDRHPRLSSRAIQQRGRLYWRRDAAPPRIQVLRSAAEVPPGFWDGIDLAVTTGMRVLVWSSGEKSELLAQFHHACCDGMGALNFLGDLLGYYHAALGGELPASLRRPLASCDATAPDRQEALSQPAADAPRGPVNVAAQAREYLLFRPAPIAPAGRPSRQAAPLDASAEGNLISAWLPPATAVALRETAQSCGVTVNDLLLRDFFLEVHQWNSARRRWLGSRRLRVLMPINMRSAAQRRLPAANLMSYSFLQRRPEELTDAETLLQGIAWQTREIRRQGHGRIFLDAIEWLAQTPRLFRAILRTPGCFATAVVSNLGDPVRRIDCRLPLQDGRITAGNLVLESIVAAPPIRPRTALALAFTTYADSIGMMAMYCRKSLGREAAQELLDSYLMRLRRTAQSAAAKPSETPARAPVQLSPLESP